MSEAIFHLGIKGLITNGPGRILLLKINPAELHNNEHGEYWDLPGGRVEQGESIEDTLKRELAEEIGAIEVFNIKSLGMVLSNIRIPVGSGSVGLILGIYTCDAGEDLEITLSDEHTEYQWFDKAEAAELLRVKYPADFCELIANLT
jgi:8-oxo-dGTP diphosphatase